MIKKFALDIYPRALYVAINETDESILEFLNGNDGCEIPKIDNVTVGYESGVTDGIHGGSLIRFESKDDITPGKAAHEALHTVFTFFAYLEIDIDINMSNEHATYLIEWIVDRIFETKMLCE